MIPVTIVTGFLGSGKTTLILNLLPQLPKDYKLALLKNEFGDLAVDSQLASSTAISGVQELLNGCICCNLVGQLGDALEALRENVKPDRIIIETSGSAFPATLAMEVNRLGRESGHYTLDGVVSVIDVENWKGYEDTSYTAKMQARFTDLIVFNKWELVDERRYEDCLDRVGDLDIQVAGVKSDKGFVAQDLLLGLDSALAKSMSIESGHPHHKHDHASDHESEVEVLSLSLSSSAPSRHGVNPTTLEDFLRTVPKDEIYRIKGNVFLDQAPSPESSSALGAHATGQAAEYILNWAFGRWTFSMLAKPLAVDQDDGSRPDHNNGLILRLTIVTARSESEKWKKRLAVGPFLGLEPSQCKEILEVQRIS